MADYGVTIKGIKKAEPLINSGQPVRLEFRDETWNWVMVEALVAYEPIEGGVEVDVVSEGGAQSAIGKAVYVKVLRTLSEDDVVSKVDITKLTTD